MANQENMRMVSLLNVEGRDSLKNDIFFFSNGDRPDVNIILFCGDLQNESIIMSAHCQFGSFAEKWSYESVAKLLLDRIGLASIIHLWIIRASRWSQNTLAFYDNFVHYNTDGSPDYSGISNVGGTSFAAWRHLDALMIKAVSSIKDASINVPCAIIGFSKGCSVLTQFIYELGLFFDESYFVDYLHVTSRLSSLTWLDSGHNGVNHLWPTWTVPLARLRQHPSLPKLLIFATPYQLCSDRPWNFRDFSTFLDILRTYKLPFYSDTFYKGVHWQCPPEGPQMERVSIDAHFEILECFPIHLCISSDPITLL
ncbi:hypothetical protein Aperf_G00000069175 [Anoplocephala perfoliata]